MLSLYVCVCTLSSSDALLSLSNLQGVLNKHLLWCNVVPCDALAATHSDAAPGADVAAPCIINTHCGVRACFYGMNVHCSACWWDVNHVDEMWCIYDITHYDAPWRTLMKCESHHHVMHWLHTMMHCSARWWDVNHIIMWCIDDIAHYDAPWRTGAPLCTPCMTCTFWYSVPTCMIVLCDT